MDLWECSPSCVKCGGNNSVLGGRLLKSLDNDATNCLSFSIASSGKCIMYYKLSFQATTSKIGTQTCAKPLMSLTHKLPFFFIQKASINSRARASELLARTETLENLASQEQEWQYAGKCAAELFQSDSSCSLTLTFKHRPVWPM